MKQLAAIAILGLWSWNAQAQPCPINVPTAVPLIVNSTIAAGTVTVSNDQTNLMVTFMTIGDWAISRLDLAVATSLAGIPQNNGQPDLSQFPYRQTFSPDVITYTFIIPLGTMFPYGTTIVVAAHASLDSPTQGHQQAWGAGPTSTLFPCSQACTSGGGCGGDGDGDNDGDNGGDRAHLNNGGGGDGCHHGDGQHGLPLHGSGIFDDGHGGQQKCGGGGGGDDDGDSQRTSPLWGGGGDGGNGCGGSGGGHGGDRSHPQGTSPQDGGGGGDGGGDHHHDGGGSDCKAGCGASYFTYMVNCIFHE